MVIFYKKWKKCNEIQLTKKNDLNIRKMANHQPSREIVDEQYEKIYRKNYDVIKEDNYENLTRCYGRPPCPFHPHK